MNIVTFPHEIYFYGDDVRLSNALDAAIVQARNTRLYSRNYAKAWLILMTPKISAWFYDDGAFFHIVDKSACPSWQEATWAIEAATDK
ncbi:MULTISPECIES: hypothetical protein [Vitreoscilla]|uniref:Uncharacterized protein n=1 Tax=Vitreoscilla stercoraria TaxID=61 RepID=A0ABY4E912_VITST|nr:MULTISPECIES: hypothetical protein [Vitreoscilla]AUZ04944.1 hypothetical protein ADP71_13240 [Vitreoscilla sp. C1]UOO91410.1 hypothetical protein LVJ81_06955 [Vitreoscilla stercoraria]